MQPPLKIKLFSPEKVHEISSLLASVVPDFDLSLFESSIYTPQWDDMELMPCMRHITAVMGQFLPNDFEKAVAYVVQAAQKAVQQNKTGFHCLVFSEYIVLHGMNAFETSMEALKNVTQSCSSEFAIRPFLEKHQAEVFKYLQEWAQHPCSHVRRLASEGCRPLLPWGGVLRSLQKNPEPILPVLELLKEDSEKYVQKSVANNLNDISKSHPQLVLNLAKRWLENDNSHTRWIAKHALRTLLKQGNVQALELFGYHPVDVKVENFQLSTDELKEGESLNFSFDAFLVSEHIENVRFEYAVDYVKANGQKHRKVFQIKSLSLEPMQKVKIKKTHSFKKMTTRRYYSGEHQISLIANGQIVSQHILFLHA